MAGRLHSGYLRLIEEAAGTLTKEEVEVKLEETGKCLERYRAYRELMGRESDVDVIDGCRCTPDEEQKWDGCDI